MYMHVYTLYMQKLTPSLYKKPTNFECIGDSIPVL